MAHPVFFSQTVAERRFEPRTGYDNPADSCIHSFSRVFSPEFLFSRMLHVAWNQWTVFLVPYCQSYGGPPQNLGLWVIAVECLFFFIMVFLSNLHIVLIQILIVLIILLEQIGTWFSGPGSSLGSHIAFTCQESFFFLI